MNTSKLIRVLAVTAVLASACGSAPAVGNAPSASPSSPATTATPTATPTPTATTSLALVTLRGSNQLVVRDITDIAHPKTVGKLGPIPPPVGYGPSLEGASGQFVSATELSNVGGPTDDNYGIPTSLFRAPLSGSPRNTVVKGSQGVMVFAWNPSGTAVVYLTSTFEATTVHLL